MPTVLLQFAPFAEGRVLFPNLHSLDLSGEGLQNNSQFFATFALLLPSSVKSLRLKFYDKKPSTVNLDRYLQVLSQAPMLETLEIDFKDIDFESRQAPSHLLSSLLRLQEIGSFDVSY